MSNGLRVSFRRLFSASFANVVTRHEEVHRCLSVQHHFDTTLRFSVQKFRW